MPFKSDKQRKYLYANEPDVARKFAMDSKKDPSMQALDEIMSETMPPMKEGTFKVEAQGVVDKDKMKKKMK